MVRNRAFLLQWIFEENRYGSYIFFFFSLVIIVYLDVITGAEVRVFSLYTFPLFVAGWYFPQAFAYLAAFLVSLSWTGAMYIEGVNFSETYIWLVNLPVDTIGCIAIVVLTNRVRDAYNREKSFGTVDLLTGLANRRAFENWSRLILAGCNRHGAAISVAFLDVDNFKPVNDQYGHTAGDNLLKRIADLLMANVRAGDLVARIGGDEFAFIFPETSVTEVTDLLQRVKKIVESDKICSSYGISLSIGALVDSAPYSPVQELLDGADKLMYTVKKNSKNGIRVKDYKRVDT